MLIQLKSEYMKDCASEGGTLAVIIGGMDFRKTDGFIQFLKLALNHVSNAYGKQDKKWQLYLDKIYGMANKLQDEHVRFTGNNREEFEAYCKNVSAVFKQDCNSPLEIPHLNIITADNLTTELEYHINEGRRLAFYYEKGAKVKKDLINELADQLNNLKMEKSGRQYGISSFLMCSGYHEHVHDALNLLLQTATHAINCSSTRFQSAHAYDIQTIENRLHYIELLMERTYYLIG